MRNYPHVQAANRYADEVVAGSIPACEWVKLACQRHIDDLKRSKKDDFPYYFDPFSGEKVCLFIENLPHIKGVWAGKPIILEPWQCFMTVVIFGWLQKEDDYRRFREAYIEVPRKNAKSTWAAAIGLYMLTEDGEPGAEVYSGATSEKQAWEVFKPAKIMAEKAEDFAEHYDVQVNASNISILDSASKFEPVIGKPGDGASPHCAITDEYHEHPTPDLYDTMITGMGARTQPLMVVITTAGSNLAGPCYDKRDQVCKILKGVFQADHVFAIIYTIDEGDDWTDIETWKKANPNFGVSVSEKFLRQRLDEAVQRASRQNIIKCKHLNLWVNAKTAWINMESWNKCKDESLKLEDFEGKRCFAGLDLASQIDVADYVKVFPEIIDGKIHYYVFAKHYLPEDKVYEENNAHYQGWANDGWIQVTDGNETDFATIEEDILEDAKKFDIVALMFDKWQATSMAQRLRAEGANTIEFRNHVSTMSAPAKELEASVLSGRFHHNGDPVLTWMASCVLARLDEKENIFPTKEKGTSGKIDGIIATIFAIAQILIDDGSDRSVYETRGLLDL